MRKRTVKAKCGEEGKTLCKVLLSVLLAAALLCSLAGGALAEEIAAEPAASGQPSSAAGSEDIEVGSQAGAPASGPEESGVGESSVEQSEVTGLENDESNNDESNTSSGTSLFLYDEQPSDAEAVQALVDAWLEDPMNTALPRWQQAIPEEWIPLGWELALEKDVETGAAYYTLRMRPMTLGFTGTNGPGQVTTEEELQNALNDALASEITLDADIVLTKPLNITRSLTLNGYNGDDDKTYTLTLAPNFVGRHIVIALGSGTVTLNNLQLVGLGGDFRNTTFNNTHFSSDTVGGLQVGMAGSLTLNNCVIEDNRADSGGGIYVDSAGKALQFIMNNCTLQNNWAHMRGGGLYFTSYASGGSVVLNGGTVLGNRTDFSGGGLYVYNAGGTVIQNGAVIASNATTGNTGQNTHGVQGGAGIATSSPLTISNATIRGNTATVNRTYSNYYYGGGINCTGVLTLNATTIEGNSAEYGGGVYVKNDAAITGCTFTGNSAEKSGGALYFNAEQSGVVIKYVTTVTNGSFTGNYAGELGGAIASLNRRYVSGSGAQEKVHLVITGNPGPVFSGNWSEGGAAWNEADPHASYESYVSINSKTVLSHSGISQPLAGQGKGSEYLAQSVSYTNLYNNYDIEINTKYYVAFDPNGGAWDYQGNPTTQTLYKFCAVNLPIGAGPEAQYPLSYSGYSFAGWFTSADCLPGEAWDLTTAQLPGFVTLYAKWTPKIPVPPAATSTPSTPSAPESAPESQPQSQAESQPQSKPASRPAATSGNNTSAPPPSEPPAPSQLPAGGPPESQPPAAPVGNYTLGAPPPGNDGTVNIFGNNVPMGSFGTHDGWSLLNLLLTALATVLALALGLYRLFGGSAKSGGTWKLRLWFTVAIGGVTLALFLILENFQLDMVVFNRWSILIIPLALVEVLTALTLLYRSERPIEQASPA